MGVNLGFEAGHGCATGHQVGDFLAGFFALLEICSNGTPNEYREVIANGHGVPAGIYNTVGGNIGIGKALHEHGLVGKTIFIGHELNTNSRHLLETGVMNFAIGHDVMVEVEAAIAHALALLAQDKPAPPPLTRVRVYTKYSCN